MAFKYKKSQLFAKKLDVPKAIREDVYNNRLSLQNYVIYELNGKIPTSCLIEKERMVLEKFGFEAIRYLDFELLGKSYMYKGIDLYDKLLELDYKPTNLNHYLYELVDEHVYISSYTPGMTSYFHTRFLSSKNLSEDDKTVAQGFMSGSTDLRSILNRWYLFKDRDLDYFLRNDYDNRKTKLKTRNIHEFMEKYGNLYYLVSEHANLYTFIKEVTDVTKSKEEKDEYIKEFLKSVLTFSKSYQIELTNEEYREIFKYIDLGEYIKEKRYIYPEKLMRELSTLDKDYLYIQHIPTHLLLDNNVLDLIEFYGLKVIVDFDKECGNLFSKNNYYLLKNWWAMFLHYAGNNHNPETCIGTKIRKDGEEDFINRPYDKYEFYESIRRCLKYGPTDSNYYDNSPDFSAISGDFRNIYSDCFIDESVVKDPVFLELFYTRQLTSHHLHEHPEYIEYLKGKDLTVPFKRRELRVNAFEYDSLYVYLTSEFGYDEGMKFLAEYHNVIEFVYLNRVLLDAYRWDVDVNVSTFKSLDDFAKYFNKMFIIPIENMYAKIPSDVPISTKITYPILFLDDSVPEDIKESYYNREFDGDIILKYPDIIKYFSTVDISYGFNKDFNWLLNITGVGGIKQSNIEKLRYLEAYAKINDASLQSEFVEFVKKHPDVEVTKLDLVTELLKKLSFSNSAEVYTFRSELAKQLLVIDDPIAGFNKIETMFTKNSLPIFMKLYKVQS